MGSVFRFRARSAGCNLRRWKHGGEGRRVTVNILVKKEGKVWNSVLPVARSEPPGQGGARSPHTHTQQVEGTYK
jgi:hypothetical protein